MEGAAKIKNVALLYWSARLAELMYDCNLGVESIAILEVKRLTDELYASP
jgi:hypothetical protein